MTDQQQLFNQLQTYQQQMQMILSQREALGIELRDINNALDELKNTDENKVFKVYGNIIIKKSKEKIEKELSERKEIIEIRLKALEKQEQSLKKKFDEIRVKLGM